MKLKQALPFVIILVISVLMITGCGGSDPGNGGSGGNGSVNIVGSWSGSVVISSKLPVETFAATINITSQSGGVFGGTINVGSSGDLSLTGTINSTGSVFTFTYTRSDGLVVNGSGTASTTALSGTFTNSAAESGTFSSTKSGSGGSASDQSLINTLLDNFQTATTSMDATTLASLCTYPYTDGSMTYPDEATAITELTSFFATLISYDAFTITNRIISVSGDSANISVVRYGKYTPKSGSVWTNTSTYILNAKKVGGNWKLSGDSRTTTGGSSSMSLSKSCFGMVK